VVFDKDAALVSELFSAFQEVLTDASLSTKKRLLSSPLFNNLVWGAAHFQDSDLLASLLQYTSLQNIKLSNQTYLKCFFAMLDARRESPVLEAEEGKEQMDKNAEQLMYLYTLLQNDCPDNFKFSFDVFQNQLNETLGVDQ